MQNEEFIEKCCAILLPIFGFLLILRTIVGFIRGKVSFRQADPMSWQEAWPLMIFNGVLGIVLIVGGTIYWRKKLKNGSYWN